MTDTVESLGTLSSCHVESWGGVIEMRTFPTCTVLQHDHGTAPQGNEISQISSCMQQLASFQYTQL